MFAISDNVARSQLFLKPLHIPSDLSNGVITGLVPLNFDDHIGPISLVLGQGAYPANISSVLLALVVPYLLHI